MNTTSEARERPILFSGEMVRAILDGRKTQTRRVVKPQPPSPAAVVHLPINRLTLCQWPDDKPGEDGQHQDHSIVCPYGTIGERLWVRETWGQLSWTCVIGKVGRQRSEVVYQAGPHPFDSDRPHGWSDKNKWRPSIHMPRWASRITLEITGVRVERLRDITEADARAEGVEPGCLTCGENCTKHGGCGYCRPSYRDSFVWLWDSINADRGFGWTVNPWVWVVSFKRITCN